MTDMILLLFHDLNQIASEFDLNRTKSTIF